MVGGISLIWAIPELDYLTVRIDTLPGRSLSLTSFCHTCEARIILASWLPLGWVKAIDMIELDGVNAIDIVAISGVNAIGIIAIGGLNAIGIIAIGGFNSIGLHRLWRLSRSGPRHHWRGPRPRDNLPHVAKALEA